jgi:hypothetical protein
MSSLAPASSPAAREWDELRTAFASSIMVNTSLSSLAQNLDGLEWPLAGRDETASAYIDLDYAELTAALAGRGHPEAAALLLQILRETLAFDQPFGEMVKQTQAAADRDNPLLRTLQRLGIPENFPLELTLLDDTARQLCRLEQVWSIGEFAMFAQRLAQGVIVGGDLRRLLNALVQADEVTLAMLLPFRPGTTGLHLAEALGQASRAADPAEHALRAVTWFEAEFATWRDGAAAGRRFLRRQLAVLNDEALERHALALLNVHLHGRPSAGPTGFWARLTGWLRR